MDSPEATVTASFDAPVLLRAMRSVLSLSQERFAELTGIKRQQLSAWENGHHSPSFDTLKTLAEKAGLELTVMVRRK